jgi:hypothetical protein
MNVFVASLAYIYSKVLRLYPRGFRGEFSDEMQVVFRDSLNQAHHDGTIPFIYICLKEFGGLPFHVLREFWHEFKKKEITMDTNEKMESKSIINESPSHWDALIGTLPFVLFGITSMIGKLRLPFWGIYANLMFYIIVLLGLLIGLIKGTPRWTYSYLGWSLVFAWWWSNMGTVGLKIFGFQIDRWTWQIWPPLFVTIGIALLLTRSLHPLRGLIRGIWQDWTLLSLAMYTFVGWMALIYDENHHPYLFAFMTASTLASSAGAWFFLYQLKTRNRIAALISGFMAVAIIGAICESTWDWRAYYGLPSQPPVVWYISALRILVIVTFWVMILFWPALVGLVRRAVNNRRVT